MQKRANIILIGFMGSGKSAISREISRLSGFSSIDTDQLIVEQQKKAIPEIFAEKGEAHFRQLEHELLLRLEQQSLRRTVLATGGGTPLRPANQILLSQMGYVVWLSASPEETLQRIGTSSHRPLLQVQNPFATIQRLMAERESAYKTVSDCVVETDHLTIGEIASGIISSASYFFSDAGRPASPQNDVLPSQ